jgi:GNAT superfamily N-acetyltransferase
MKKARYSDKNIVVDILTKSFDSNTSVNFVIKQDETRISRIKTLMAYSFDICFSFGEVFLSPENNACALVLFPDKKRITVKTIMWDLRLIWNGIGVMNVWRVMRREAKIKEMRPKELMYYVWFGGVDPKYQNKGIGTKLLNDLTQDSIVKKRAIFLETSVLKNVKLYQKHGFQIYRELELGHKLYFMKRA